MYAYLLVIKKKNNTVLKRSHYCKYWTIKKSNLDDDVTILSHRCWQRQSSIPTPSLAPPAANRLVPPLLPVWPSSCTPLRLVWPEQNLVRLVVFCPQSRACSRFLRPLWPASSSSAWEIITTLSTQGSSGVSLSTPFASSLPSLSSFSPSDAFCLSSPDHLIRSW